MAYKIHAIPASEAAAYVAEHDGVALAVFVDDAGNPVDINAPAVPAAGSVTNAMLAGGITVDKLAAGVIPATPTADTLSGATGTGKAVLKAADAAAARTAIGAGTPYTLPAAGTALGGVKKGTAVATVAAADATASAGDAPTKAEFDAVVAELNETKRQLNTLIGSLKAAGVIG